MTEKQDEFKHDNIEEQEAKEYLASVKQSAADGSYFKDGLDWYLVRYVNPLCDRTIMIFVAIASLISIYCLYIITDNAFPLVKKVPVVIRSNDQSKYVPYISPLKDKNDKTPMTVDEAIAKYLLGVYVKDRESYDFRAGNVEDVNTKFARIKNNSSSLEYKNFQSLMSKDNPQSPINNFGLNIYRTIEIQSIIFPKAEVAQDKDYYNKLKNFLVAKIPTEAEVRFTTVTNTVLENGVASQERENYLARINFNFAGADRDAKSGVLDFTVNNYKLFKIK